MQVPVKYETVLNLKTAKTLGHWQIGWFLTAQGTRLGVEPGRGSDVDANSPGRKIGDSGLCLDFLCKTMAS
jgi:hypothetical protein